MNKQTLPAVEGPVDRQVRPRFERTYCSQCGGQFGPGDSGFSHCSDHQFAMRAALADMLAGWRYIRQSHGDLYGVGWDRAQEKAEKALGLQPGQAMPAEWFGA